MRGKTLQLWAVLVAALLMAAAGYVGVTAGAEKPIANASGAVAISAVQERWGLGDVKYSVLDPTKFTEINGPGWVLMNGQSIEGSDLFALTGVKTAPDARGVFIRGMNLGRDPNTGDSDGDRQVGSFQNYQTRKHSHIINPLTVGHSNNGNGGAHQIVSDDGGSWNNISIRQTTDEVGGEETRPKNITLYAYIKVSR